MLAYVEGILEEAGADWAVVGVGGLGWRLEVPSGSRLPPVGNRVKLLTHIIFREDNLQLCGFLEAGELKIFKLLLGVNGVGPRVAMALLGAVKWDLLEEAIINERIDLLTAAPGVGKKSAQRIVMELKDKMGRLNSAGIAVTSGAGRVPMEVIEALQALGYQPDEVRPAMLLASEKLGANAENAALLRLTLQLLGKNKE